MLVIRLARTGKKKQAYFRVVVQEKQRAVGAKFIEILGNYNPHEKKLEIKEDRLKEYMKNGAQPSNTLAKILKAEKIEMPKWVKINERNRPAKKKEEDKKEEVKAEAKEEAPKTEGVEEAPVEEEAKKEDPSTKAQDDTKVSEEVADEPKEEAVTEPVQADEKSDGTEK